MPLPKFNFIPEHQLKSEFSSYSPQRVSIYVNGNNINLAFSPDTCKIYDLNGKHIKLWSDPGKNVIGWSILENVTTTLEELNGARQLKVSSNNVAVVGIKKLLQAAGIKVTKSQKNLEVKTFKSPLYAQDIYYVEIQPEK